MRSAFVAVNVTLNDGQEARVTLTARQAVFVTLAIRRGLRATFTAGSAAHSFPSPAKPRQNNSQGCGREAPAGGVTTANTNTTPAYEYS